MLLMLVHDAYGEPQHEPQTSEQNLYTDLDMVGALVKFYNGLNPFNEFAEVKVPQLSWLLAKAQCETGMDWQNGGTYGGAFGFMHRGYETDKSGLPENSTWGRWGGFHFAKLPKYATPYEQVVVYLRINWAGWHRPNGMFRKPSSSQDTDNLCYIYANDTAGKADLRIRNMSDYYADFTHALQKQHK